MARKWGAFRRFRLIAVPGAAGVAGVPANREAVLREELAPIFAALRSVQEDAQRSIARAAAESTARAARAMEESERIIEEARSREASERASSAEALRSSAQSEASAVRTSALEEAERISRLGAERIPGMVSTLVAHVMSNANSTKAST